MTNEQRALWRVHEALYPERYHPPGWLAARGLPTDGGYYQWSPDTPQAISDLLDVELRRLRVPGINLNPTPLP